MLLPVIDLKGGLVVRGVAGNRKEYRPVVSSLAAEPTPAAVADAFAKELGAVDVYVADLDAIAGAEPDWRSLANISQAGLRIWLDCGVGSVGRATSLVEFAERVGSFEAIIVGLESTPDDVTLREVLRAVGAELGVFSLDLKHGVPLSTSPTWQSQRPVEIARAAAEVGFRRMVVLDLAQVGVEGGPSVALLCHELHAALPHMELIAGGGVRHAEDAAVLMAAGCRRVLVASALHSGVLRAL